MKWFTKKNSDNWTAISCAEEKTSIATVSKRQHQKPFVIQTGIEQGNLDNQQLLKTLIQNYNAKELRCSFVLGFSHCQLLQVEKPNVAPEELKQAVSWKIKDLIDYPVEQATVDIVNIPPDPSNSKRQQYAYAVAANNEALARMTNQLINAKVNLQAIDARVFAQRNIASLLEEDNRGLAMLSFNNAGGLLTFTAGGELYHARRIEIDNARSKTAFETMSLELQRSLDHFESQFPYVAINKLLVAPFELRDSFADHLRDYINLPIVKFELSDIFDFDEKVELGDLSRQASLLPVLGAALREELAA